MDQYRIFRLFVAMTKNRVLNGAKIWFAREQGVSVKTVQRWCAGQTDPANSNEGQRALAWVDAMEVQYADQLERAERQIERYLDLHRTIAEGLLSRQAYYERYEREPKPKREV